LPYDHKQRKREQQYTYNMQNIQEPPLYNLPPPYKRENKYNKFDKINIDEIYMIEMEKMVNKLIED
jgi:hypothetical protein